MLGAPVVVLRTHTKGAFFASFAKDTPASSGFRIQRLFASGDSQTAD